MHQTATTKLDKNVSDMFHVLIISCFTGRIFRNAWTTKAHVALAGRRSARFVVLERLGFFDNDGQVACDVFRAPEEGRICIFGVLGAPSEKMMRALLQGNDPECSRALHHGRWGLRVTVSFEVRVYATPRR